MVASLLLHALKGAHAEILEEQGILDRLKKVGQLTAVFAGELNAAAGLTPYGIRSLRVRSAIPIAGTAAATAAAPYGVVLFPAVPYGPKPRHLLDIYVPAHIYQQIQRQQQQEPRWQQQQEEASSGQQQQQQQQPVGGPSQGPQIAQQQQQQDVNLARSPVVFFCHGGIWATGERWQFGPMATRLSQAGVVTVVISYTLYPEVLAGEMAGEVLQALLWTINNIHRYGGCNKNVTVMGHSAGGHLGALALMMLAQHRCQQQQPQQQQQRGRQQQQQQRGRQQQQQQGPPDVGSSSGNGQQQQQQVDYLSLPLPKVFIGMSAVYDIALHFEFESQRGVAGISTMARACGGAALFDAVSPAVLLRKAAAAAADMAAAGQQQQHRQGQQQWRWQQQQVQWPDMQRAAEAGGYNFIPADHGNPVPGDLTAAAAARQSPAAAGQAASNFQVAPGRQQQWQQQQHPQLLGELIPYRSGMIPGPIAAAVAARQPPGSSLCGIVPPMLAAAAAGVHDATVVLRGFSLDAAKHLPPCIITNSCADQLVPWHEGSDMLQALKSCHVPAKQLIYDRHLHNDFVFDWKPLVSTAASSSSSSSGDLAEVAGLTANPTAAAAAVADSSMPAFARDLLSIITGAVQVQFDSSRSQPENPWQAPGAAAAAAVNGVPDIASRDDSIHLRGRWFAVPRPRL